MKWANDPNDFCVVWVVIAIALFVLVWLAFTNVGRAAMTSTLNLKVIP